MAEGLANDGLQGFFREVEMMENRKMQIQKLTEALLGKTKLKLKLQTKESRQEDNFNKKLETMKSLKTFVDARQQINRMNILNDPNVLIKLNTIKYLKKDEFHTKPHQPDKFLFTEGEINQVSCDPNNGSSDFRLELAGKYDYEPIAKKHFQIPKRTLSQPTLYPEEQEDKLCIKLDSPKYDTNYFYKSAFQQDKSPTKKQDHQRRAQNTAIKNYLEKKGLLGQQKRNSVIYQQYYANYHQDTSNLIKEVKMEAKHRLVRRDRLRKSCENNQRKISEGTRKLLLKNQEIYRRHGKLASYQENKCTTFQTQHSSFSPCKFSQLFLPKQCHQVADGQATTRTLCKSQRSPSRVAYNWQNEHNYQSPQKTRVLSQMERFTDTIFSTENDFQKINDSNKQMFRRMSTAISTVHNKYKNDFIID